MSDNGNGTKQDVATRNLLLTAVIAMLGGGTVSGISVDQLFGGAAAREERDAQIALVVDAAERAARQYEDRIAGIQAKYDVMNESRQELKELFLECNQARLDERVSIDTIVPDSALEAIE